MKTCVGDLGGNLCRHLDSGSVFTGPAGGGAENPCRRSRYRRPRRTGQKAVQTVPSGDSLDGTMLCRC